jgi:transposase
MSYTSDVSEYEWEVLEPILMSLIAKKAKTKPNKWGYRAIINGIFYQLKDGCSWMDLPKDLPPYSTVYWHYKQWKSEGIIERLMNELHYKVRESIKKK